MQPEKPNEQPVPVPTAPIAPTVLAQAAFQQPVTAAQPNSSTGFLPPVVTSSNGKSLLVGGIIAAVALLIVGAALFLVLVLPRMQSASLAKSFMDNITAGNVDKAVEQTGDTTTKTFLTSAAVTLKDEKASLSKQQFNRSGESYYLFMLTGGAKKYSRVSIAKDNGKRVVTTLVYSANEIALVPGKSTSNNTDTAAQSSSPVSPTGDQMACLTNSDYRYMNYDKSMPTVEYDTTYDPAKNTLNYTTNMFFQPDTIIESNFMSTYDDWADFAKQNADKQWKFRLEGSIYGTDPKGVTLANQRSQKVQDELIKRGVPASRIVIEPARDYSNESQEERIAHIYRHVQIVIDPTCSSTSTVSTPGAEQ